MELKELKEISKKNLEFVKDYYTENNQGFQPMIIVYANKNSKRIIISAILGNDKAVESRFEVLSNLGIDFGVRTFLKKEYDSVDAIFTLNEAWMTRHSKKEDIKRVLMPSIDPNHLEILMSAGLSSDDKAAADIKIIRKSWVDNKITVSFEELNQGEKEEDADEKLEIKSNLLECFWKAFKLIEGFSEILEQNKGGNERAKKEIKEKTSEELVDIYTKIFYQFIKDKAQK